MELLRTAALLALAACSGNYRSNDRDAAGDADTSDADAAQSAGDGATSDGSSGAKCLLPQFYSNACQPCADGKCCSEQQQCAQDPDCNAYALCILKCAHDVGCPAPTCESNCGSMYSAGYNKLNGGGSLDSCVYSQCGSSCETSCPP
jgi:hypothetical protein